jgi:anti-sigma-K factor RskA
MTERTEHAWLEHTAAYALGALDEQERTSFEAHLETCDICRVEVRELREVAGLLATAAAHAPPPPGLRERILSDARGVRPLSAGSIAAGKESAAPISTGPISAGTISPNGQSAIPIARAASTLRDRRGDAVAKRPFGIVPWLVAIAASIAAVALGLQSRGERNARAAVEQALASARATMDSTRVTLARRDSLIASLVAPDVEAVSVSGAGPSPSAKYFLDRRAGRIVIAASSLPPAANGRTYQLWGIETGRPPVSLGTFNTDSSGRVLTSLPIPSGLRIAVTAVTDEPSGGSPQPTTTPFLAATWKSE